jgi:hypothetical protein
MDQVHGDFGKMKVIFNIQYPSLKYKKLITNRKVHNKSVI